MTTPEQERLLVIAHPVLGTIGDDEIERALSTSQRMVGWDRVDVTPLELRLAHLNDVDWRAAEQAQERLFSERVKPRLRGRSRVAYFGFAPIPLAMHLGYLFERGLAIDVYQRQRQSPDWVREPEGEASPSPAVQPIHLPEHESAEVGPVVVRVATSYPITPRETAALVPVSLAEVDVALVHLQGDGLATPGAMAEVTKAFNDVLGAVKARFPRQTAIHVFASIPVGLAFRLGMQINPTIYPEVITYQYWGRESPWYGRAIVLNRVSAPGGQELPPPSVSVRSAEARETNQRLYWQQKLVQLLHDPPGKAFFLRAGVGGHKAVSANLFAATAGVPLKYVAREPDHAAAGADRPVSSPPSRQRGKRPISVDWVKYPILTHPLASGSKSGSCTAIDLGAQQTPVTHKALRVLADSVAHALGQLVEVREEPEADGDSGAEDDREPIEGEHSEDQAKLAALPLWQNEVQLQQACLKLWRRLPEEPPAGVAGVVWRHQPADSRTPDHSLWDHLRVTSSLAFLSRRKQEGPALPWLVAFSIGPVQRFIAQSRTSRDLWTTSMLLSDLVWHAMVPFVEQYGPEAIVYPDLRGNPRADQWLWEKANGEKPDGAYLDVLPEKRHPSSSEGFNPCSHAGIFPNTFIALVPIGGEGHLERLQTLASKAREGVQRRWGELAELARVYFLKQARSLNMSRREEEGFNQTWAQQHREVLFTAWSAAAWPNVERVKDPKALAIRDSLPAQARAPELSPEDARALEGWRDRHTPWIPTEAFARYAEARHVYAKTNLGVHQLQRGFDYPLIHHALFTRHQVHKAEAHGATLSEEKGEKCTLCGLRQALGGGVDASIDRQREVVRSFWRRFDRNSDGGSERLCAVCTMKRVLIPAGLRTENGVSRMVGLTAAWAGPATPMDEVRDTDGEIRVPFPSTATVAAQAYLCAVVTHPKLTGEVGEVVRCCEAAGLPRTSFVRSLRLLADTATSVDAAGRLFLEYEAEIMVFPEVLTAAEERAPNDLAAAMDVPDLSSGTLRNRQGEPVPRSKIKVLRNAVQSLRSAAAACGIPAPGTQTAMIALDGDGIRGVLLGTGIDARWRDVIHPEVVAQMETNEVTRAAGWPSLLDSKRLMGPSTHAFVNRVLADFAHTIVPWVVEREFQGRLIYAGGDDVLALAPAGDALAICARLAQLYSAAWVLDTRPWEEPWDWRRKQRSNDSASRSATTTAQDRFVVVAPDRSGEALPWPIPMESRRGSIVTTEGGATDAASEQERLLPMMGAGQTLTAGIAIGHYKTPLGGLVKAAWDERDRAKGKGEDDREGEGTIRKNAFSIRRYTRGGAKARLILSWGDPKAASGQGLEGYLRARRVIEGFRTGALPGRLPYKLREVEEPVFAVWLSGMKEVREAPTDMEKQARTELVARVRTLAEGLFGGQVDKAAHEAFEIWWLGLLGAFREREQGWDDARGASPGKDPLDEDTGARGIGSEQGLAVCRFLGALARGEEDVR